MKSWTKQQNGFLHGRYNSYCKAVYKLNLKPMSFKQFLPFASATNAELIKSHIPA